MERTKEHRGCAHGFTVVEVVVIVVVLIILIAIFLPISTTSRGGNFSSKDSSQVRGVLQALVLFSQSNGNQYPLPSATDVDNNTVPELGTCKDTSANMYSLLLWNGLVTVELLMSPVEVGNVKKYEGYELSNPKAAVNPGKALWDPAFRADFTGKDPGGVSYAHMLPGGTRTKSWMNTFDVTQVVVSNRGPKISGVTHTSEGAVDTIDADKKSITYRFYRPFKEWSGNIGYNDNHVKFEQSMTGSNLTYLNADGKERTDLIFYDEPDDPTGANIFLSLFITAGNKRSDFKSIWD